MVIIQKGKLKHAVKLAMDWLADIAFKNEEQLTDEKNVLNAEHVYWKGSIRNEYIVALKKWVYYAPIWHSGQALKSLILASQLDFIEDKLKYLHKAKEIARFILKNQIWDEKDPDHGLILAYEDVPEAVTISGILEATHGLFLLTDLTGDNLYRDRVLKALDYCAKKFYRKEEGLFNDAYNYKKRIILNPYQSKKAEVGRPLQDDSMFLRAYKLTNNETYNTIFWEIIDKLMKDENPAGNWIKYWPCVKSVGEIHPRHAYWWGMPFIEAYNEITEQKYFDMAKRCCDWYAKAIRRDGGLFRRTYRDFNTESFGHATSGSACAAILWISYRELTDSKEYDNLIRTVIMYNMKMQFTNPMDPALKGCILEKVLPPNGTDRNPYFIRDLGTIFFIQAAVKYLNNF